MNTVLPRVGDAQMQRLIDMLEKAINALEAASLNQAVTVTQAIGFTDTRVYHGMGRVPIGYIGIRSDTPTTLYDGVVAETIDPANYISLRCSTAATVTILIF